MSNALWPVGLPQAPLVSRLREQFPSRVIRTEMDAGPAKVRQRFTAQVTPVEIELRITRDQVALLREFYLDTLEGGALVFEWLDHRTGEPALYRFTAPPVVIPRSPRENGSDAWVATFPAEIMPAPVDDDPPPTPPDTAGGGAGVDQSGTGGGGAAPPRRDGPGEPVIMPVFFEAVAPEPDFLIDIVMQFNAPSGSPAMRADAIVGAPAIPNVEQATIGPGGSHQGGT